jgi:hypothetical protein
MSFLEECTLQKVFAHLPLLLDLVISFVSKGSLKVVDLQPHLFTK